MSSFYGKYVTRCAKAQKTPSGAAIEMGLSKTAVNAWKHGRAKPTDATVHRVADYFGITVDELLSENENEKKPAPKDGNELTDVQREALELIQEMTDDQLRVFIATLKASRG